MARDKEMLIVSSKDNFWSGFFKAAGAITAAAVAVVAAPVVLPMAGAAIASGGAALGGALTGIGLSGAGGAVAGTAAVLGQSTAAISRGWQVPNSARAAEQMSDRSPKANGSS